MSTNVFAGARKALVTSIALAALMGGFTVATAPLAVAASATAASAATANINAFTNTDWLNGVWR
ncbi:glycoside hydrolase family 5 protein, partial [Pseudomonas sp. AL-54]|nr:glycoside hydrolase family 5 protein [Pseudomonas lopnurensis]